MRFGKWQYGIRVRLILAVLVLVPVVHGQDYPDIPGYVPGTPPWVPLIDACMTAGGQRNDCIEALPPDMYAEFLAAERARAAERAALLQLARTPPQVPPPEELAHIYKSPLSVPELPGNVAEELAATGCLVPQSLGGDSNVVTGELAAAGQKDLAVICSVNGVSEIRIFWGGNASCPPLDETSPDWALLYQAAEWEYFWAIALASPEHIRSYYDKYPEECPLQDLPVMIHDGLEHIFEEKGSANLYCHEGQWLRLCGAD
jgi:hypothetical protein